MMIGACLAGVRTSRVAFSRAFRKGRRCLVIERLEPRHARGRDAAGDPCREYGTSADAYHLTCRSSEGHGAPKSNARALENGRADTC